MRFHKEGFPLLYFVSAIATGIILLVWFNIENIWISAFLILVTLVVEVLITQFFRLPKRINRSEHNQLVAPCDGKVVAIEEIVDPEYFKDKRIQLSIFMSPLNVHANWCPCAGSVEYVQYHKGLYLVAWHPKSSTDNERNTVVIKAANGKSVLLRQIAGAVARRIRCYVHPGQTVQRNDEFGFIKFGSRVDVILPVGTTINVKIGDVTTGNETVIASW